MPYALVRQHDEKDCGAACLSTVFQTYGNKEPLVKFRDRVKTNINGTSTYNISQASIKLGINAEVLSGDFSDLIIGINSNDFTYPFIAHLIVDARLLHFVVVHKITKNKIIIADPGVGIVKYSVERFKELWTGNIIVFEKTSSFTAVKEQNIILKMCAEILKENKFKISVTVILSILVTLVSFSIPIFMKELIDEVTHFADHLDNVHFSNLQRSLMLILIITLIGSVFEFIRDKIFIKFSLIFTNIISERFYDKLLNLKLSFFNSRKDGEITTRFSEITMIMGTITSVIMSFTVGLLTIIISFIVLANISLQLLVIMMVMVILYFLTIIIYSKKIKSIESNLLERYTEVNSSLQESVTGINIIKTFVGEKQSKVKMKNLLCDYVKTSEKSLNLEISKKNISKIIHQTGIISIVFIGIIGILNNSVFGKIKVSQLAPKR